MGGRRGRGGAERRGEGPGAEGGGHDEGRPHAGGGDEEGYRQKVNERFDRLAERVERLEEEVRQLRGGGSGGGSRGA